MPASSPSTRMASGTVLALGLGLAVAAWVRSFSDTLDDAFITFRSVHNLVGGHGLTFNRGWAPVESFSNPLLTALLVPFAALGMPLPWVARGLGAAGYLAAAWAAERMARRSGASELARAVVVGTTLGSTALVYYASTGLETALLSGLLLVALDRTSERRSLDAPSALLWFSIAMSRPETPLVVGLSLLALLTPPLSRGTWRALAGIAAALVALEILRIAYYHDVVPNTFHAKAAGSADHDPSSNGLWVGPWYVLRFALACGLVLPLGVLASIRSWHTDPSCRGGLAALAGGVIFALYAGGDWMPMGRYLVPYVPLVSLLGTLGLASLAARGVLRRPSWALGAAALASFLASADALSDLWLHQREYPYHVMASSDSLRAIERMGPMLAPHSRVVAFRIGALGDVGGYEVIDLLGLTDRHIAEIVSSTPGYHPQNSRMGDAVPALREYVTSLDPDAFLLVTFAEGDLDPQVELYDLPFDFREAFPIGVDQRWALYVRHR